MSMVKVMKIDEWLEKKSLEKDAIIFKDQNWTFSHLKKLITKTSLFLQNECQLKVGDRFCYYGTNNPEQIVLLFAASKIGAIMFPINWRLANPEIEYLIKHSNPNVIFFDTKFVFLGGLDGSADEAWNQGGKKGACPSQTVVHFGCIFCTFSVFVCSVFLVHL